MKNYLVIGASSGIGNAITEQLGSEGNRVYATYNKNKLPNSSQVTYHHLDVTTDFVLHFLPERLDGIVYCPGSINLKPFTRFKGDAFLDDFKLQVLGAIKTIQLGLPALRASNHASIVLFSSVAAQYGYNFHSQVSVSKGAIEGLTKSLASEFAPNIRVNAIALSLTDTPLAAKLLSNEQKREANAQRHPLKRIGTAADIAHSTLFLLSEKSSWITGQILSVDGGMSSINM